MAAHGRPWTCSSHFGVAGKPLAASSGRRHDAACYKVSFLQMLHDDDHYDDGCMWLLSHTPALVLSVFSPSGFVVAESPASHMSLVTSVTALNPRLSSRDPIRRLRAARAAKPLLPASLSLTTTCTRAMDPGLDIKSAQAPKPSELALPPSRPAPEEGLPSVKKRAETRSKRPGDADRHHAASACQSRAQFSMFLSSELRKSAAGSICRPYMRSANAARWRRHLTAGSQQKPSIGQASEKCWKQGHPCQGKRRLKPGRQCIGDAWRLRGM